MPLHHHSPLRDELLESAFSGDSCRTPLPASRFPEAEQRADETFQAISDELLLDGNARQNLATFCQTWEEDEVHRLMDLSINKNMIDKDEYPQTAEIERRCVQMLADLWNAPDRAAPSAARQSGRRKHACWAAWPPNGAGAPSARQRESPRTNRTWCAGRSRSCGTSSPNTGTSRCGRFRCPQGSTSWTSTRCSPRWTRTRSWSSLPSA